LNGADTPWFADDLELLDRPGVTGVVLPKAESAEQIDVVTARGRSGLSIVPLVESALGLWHVERIAKAPGVELLAFGAIDFQLDTGIAGDSDELLMARSQLVLISRVAGLLPPIDGVTAESRRRTSPSRRCRPGPAPGLRRQAVRPSKWCCGERRLLTPADGTGVELGSDGGRGERTG
jgi:citrate lyase beta subunit